MRLIHVHNKKTANIFLRVVVLVLDDNFAPKCAVKTLVEEINNTINTFT